MSSMTASPSPSAFWNQIEAILIINMKQRTDRWAGLHKTLAEIGVEDKVIRIEAIDGKILPGYLQKPWFGKRTSPKVASMKAGSAGCTLSHRKAIAYAKMKGFKRILLLEDDALFTNDLNGREGEMIADVISDLSCWDMFYLGFYQRLNKHYVAKSETIDNNKFELWRIRGPLLAHAIVINASIYDKLLEGFPQEKNIWPWITYWGVNDSWIYNKFGRDAKIKIWATMPKLVMQLAGYSDICGRKLTIEESEGRHRTSKLISLDKKQFEHSIDLSLGEQIYQKLKRTSRLIRVRLFGYKKT